MHYNYALCIPYFLIINYVAIIFFRRTRPLPPLSTSAFQPPSCVFAPYLSLLLLRSMTVSTVNKLTTCDAHVMHM